MGRLNLSIISICLLSLFVVDPLLQLGTLYFEFSLDQSKNRAVCDCCCGEACPMSGGKCCCADNNPSSIYVHFLVVDDCRNLSQQDMLVSSIFSAAKCYFQNNESLLYIEIQTSNYLASQKLASLYKRKPLIPPPQFST